MLNTSVSVIIPAYNRAKTIIYCLDSVCNQTVHPYEVIVVDDCSTDATVEIVNNYALSHSFVRSVALRSNSGAQAARNRGIMEAVGKWIAFQDSDDEWEPCKLEKQIAVLASHNWHENIVVHSDMIRYYPEKEKIETWDLPSVTGNACYPQLLQSPGPLFQTLMVSKTALSAIGYLDEDVPAFQEWDTAIRLAKICEFVHIREPLAVYWLHEGETISKNNRRGVEGYRYIIEKHRPEIERVLGENGWYRHCTNLVFRYSRFGYFEDAEEMTLQLPKFSYWYLKSLYIIQKARLQQAQTKYD